MSNKVKTLTLAAWNDAYGNNMANGLFVVNNLKQEADVIFNIKSIDGRDSAVMIPSTNAPIDLLSISTRDSLLNSPEFKRLLNNQVLRIVDNEDAERVLAESPSLREAARVALQKDSTLEVLNNGASDTLEIKGAAKAKVNSNEADNDDDVGDITNVDRILEVSEDPNSTDTQIVQIFTRFSRSLTEDDFMSLMEKSKNQKLQDLVSEYI